MTTRTLWTFILAVTVIGCNPEARPDEFRTGGLTQPQVDALQLAVDMWCGATDGRACATLAGGERTWSSSAWVKDLSPGLAGQHAGGTDGLSIIWADVDRTGDALVETWVHELGHHWGLEDNDDPASVLYRNAGDLRWPNAVDVAGVQR